MRKIFYYILLIAGACGTLEACSSGDYIANPSTNANSSIDPLNPLTSSQFTWTGTTPLSGNFNGTPFVMDTAYYSFIDTGSDPVGTNCISGYSGNMAMYLYFKNVYAGNLYNMGYNQYNILGMFLEGVGTPATYYLSALGNSGEMKLIANDSLHFTGQFYFQGVNSTGQVINITNGYFNLLKN